MMKLVFAAAFAALIGVPDAAAQGLFQRSDWQGPQIRNLPATCKNDRAVA